MRSVTVQKSKNQLKPHQRQGDTSNCLQYKKANERDQSNINITLFT